MPRQYFIYSLFFALTPTLGCLPCATVKALSACLSPPPGLEEPAQRPQRRRGRPRAVLEIFSGCSRLLAAASQQGLEVAAPVDLECGPWFNLLDRRVVNHVKALIRSRRVWYVHLGTPCTSWGVSTSEVSKDKHRATGSTLAKVTLEIIMLCRRCGVHWSIENPLSSGLWR